jgi:hypothetical protein
MLAMFCDIKVAIDIADNLKTGKRSKHINIAYHLVCEHGESGYISHLQVVLAKTLADICTKRPPEVT